MEKATYAVTLESILDDLAAIEHERWSHWQRYMHAKAEKQADGSLVIPRELVSRWEGQIQRPYAELTEEERESDRDQVRKYLPRIVRALEEAEHETVDTHQRA